MAPLPIGSHRTWRGCWSNEYNFYVVAMRDSKYVTQLMPTHGTAALSNKTVKRKEVADPFNITTTMEDYYEARHCVDDNNHNRQGVPNFEQSWCTRTWFHRHFAFHLALSETNSMLAYNHFIRKPNDRPVAGIKKFRRMLVKGLLGYVGEESGIGADVVHDSGGHVLRKAPKFTGKWDGTAFRRCTSEYLQRPCSGPNCRSHIRTYCSCVIP